MTNNECNCYNEWVFVKSFSQQHILLLDLELKIIPFLYNK